MVAASETVHSPLCIPPRVTLMHAPLMYPRGGMHECLVIWRSVRPHRPWCVPSYTLKPATHRRKCNRALGRSGSLAVPQLTDLRDDESGVQDLLRGK